MGFARRRGKIRFLNRYYSGTRPSIELRFFKKLTDIFAYTVEDFLALLL
jgi:hypothetical protein